MTREQRLAAAVRFRQEIAKAKSSIQTGSIIVAGTDRRGVFTAPSGIPGGGRCKPFSAISLNSGQLELRITKVPGSTIDMTCAEVSLVSDCHEFQTPRTQLEIIAQKMRLFKTFCALLLTKLPQ